MHDTSISVRAARAEDIEAMAAVQAAGWRQGFAGIVPHELAPSAEQLASHMRERFADPSCGRAVAEQDGVLRGFCLFGPSRDEGSEPGIGELAELGKGEFRSVTLWSAAENARANSFYEKLGF